MKKEKPTIHFTHTYLLNPTNPVLVNLIGCGGTGSQVLTALARMHQSLLALRHPGLMVRVFDDDTVTEANLGRQLFAASEIGMNKGEALTSRLNRFFGTNWKAFPVRYNRSNLPRISKNAPAHITVTCVDTAKARLEIAGILREGFNNLHNMACPIYWLDFGNRQHTGQVVLGTVNPVKQPKSKRYHPVAALPFITEEFNELIHDADEEDLPSCSLAEALTRQDLFINSTIAQTGASLLWQLFREGMTFHRGFFMNLKDFRSQPLKVA